MNFINFKEYLVKGQKDADQQGRTMCLWVVYQHGWKHGPELWVRPPAWVAMDLDLYIICKVIATFEPTKPTISEDENVWTRTQDALPPVGVEVLARGSLGTLMARRYEGGHGLSYWTYRGQTHPLDLADVTQWFRPSLSPHTN